MTRDAPHFSVLFHDLAGKTTQCPQFLLEEAFNNGYGDQISVITTQPRRVAATSVAERVSEEMVEPLGQTVGYQIRMDIKKSKNTRLLFCTTGVVLRRLQDDPLLSGITHICVDEVHERQYQVGTVSDFLRCNGYCSRSGPNNYGIVFCC